MDAELEALRHALDLKPDDVDVDRLRPILAPASFFESEWPGPLVRFGESPLALTWAVLQPDQTMLYVTSALQVYWERQGLDCRGRALDNLARDSTQAWTHEFRFDSGGAYAVVMMHDDGLGPSRLLLESRLSELFPDGYRG